MSTIKKEFFAQAASEVADGHVDTALYVKALALSEGAESKARALYISMRAEEIDHAYKMNVRTDATAKVVQRSTGVAKRLLLALGSLIIPGTGQIFCGHRSVAAKFFAAWLCIYIATLSILFLLDGADESWASLSTWPTMLLVLLPLANWTVSIWSAIDVFTRSRVAPRTGSAQLGKV